MGPPGASAFRRAIESVNYAAAMTDGAEGPAAARGGPPAGRNER